MKELIDGRIIHPYIDPQLTKPKEGDIVEVVRNAKHVPKYVPTGMFGKITNVTCDEVSGNYSNPICTIESEKKDSPFNDSYVFRAEELMMKDSGLTKQHIKWLGDPPIDIILERTLDGVLIGEAQNTELDGKEVVLATSLDWLLTYVERNREDVPCEQITPNISIPAFEKCGANKVSLGQRIEGETMFSNEMENERPSPHLSIRAEVSKMSMWNDDLWLSVQKQQ